MDFNHIKKFLENFKNLIYQKEEEKNLVLELISKEISYKLGKDSLSIKNNLLYIKCSPIIRSEILIHKKQILLKIKENLPNSNFLDIK